MSLMKRFAEQNPAAVRGRTGQFVTGVKELDRKLERMSDSLQKKAMRVATRKAANAVRDDAKTLAPHLSGALENSIKTRALPRSTTRKGRQTRVGHMVQVSEGFFKGEEFYAGFIEFGTSPRETSSGANRGLIPDLTFSFLRPALYAKRHEKIAIFHTELKRWFYSQGIAR